MKKEFNPKEWLTNPVSNNAEKVSNNTATHNKTLIISDTNNSIENYIALIEQSGIDITNNYTNWLNIGFAIADKYGESGRNYFCRISKINPYY